MRRRFVNETGHWANLGLSSCTAANKKLPKGHFLDWLGKIKQALTIYKEDIRQRLEDYDPESK